MEYLSCALNPQRHRSKSHSQVMSCQFVQIFVLGCGFVLKAITFSEDSRQLSRSLRNRAQSLISFFANRQRCQPSRLNPANYINSSPFIGTTNCWKSPRDARWPLTPGSELQMPIYDRTDFSRFWKQLTAAPAGDHSHLSPHKILLHNIIHKP